MNDGSSAASTVGGAPRHGAEDPTPEPSSSNADATNAISKTAPGTWQERARSKRKAALEKLFETLDHLVYIQLVSLYYCDTATLLLILRLVTNLTSLPATLALLPSPLRGNQRHSHTNLWTVLSVNILAVLIHVFFPLASADETTRYDLSGHLVVDFVGQRALSGGWGRARLVVMDLLVMLLQGIGVGVLLAIEGLEKQTRKQGPTTVSSDTAHRATAAANAAISALMRRGGNWIGRSQGVSAAPTRTTTDQEDDSIEMRELSTPMVPEGESHEERTGPEAESPQPENDTETSERSGLLPTTTALPVTPESDPSEDGMSPNEAQGRRELEALYSGESALVDIRFWQILRDQYYERRNRALAGRV